MDNFFSKNKIFFKLVIYLTKVINKLLKKLNLGSGNTLPGYIALNIYPSILMHKSLFPKKGLIFVSATNGKTTTTKIISHVLQKSGFSVTTNSSGSNLLRGIITTLILNSTSDGNAKDDFGVFEVDEFALPLILKNVSPDVLLLLNISRDQLDRYGETDTILDRWKDSLLNSDKNITVVLPANDLEFKNTFVDLKTDVKYFEPYIYPDEKSVLRGKYNEKNLGAALVALNKFNIKSEDAIKKLQDFNLAWGRGEEILYQENLWKIYLAKNPASFNANLDELLSAKNKGSLGVLFFILNDNIPDGRDVSWIYDVEPKKIQDVCDGQNLLVAGQRSLDMAVRLKYAQVNIKESNVILDLTSAVESLSSKYKNEKIIVLSNYSGMLQLRKILTGRSIL